MKITVVTSSRADWNSTGMVVRALLADPAFDVSLMAITASGAALEALTKAVVEDGLNWERGVVHSLDLTLDDGVNLAAAAGDACRFAGEALYRLRPDWVFLPGDRWEIASVAFATSLSSIPIAHLAGGDVTEGSMDDKFRDAITAVASLHFTTNARAHDRLKQNWVRGSVHLVGSPSVDRIMQMKLLSEIALRKEIGVAGSDPDRPLIVVNWQPETMSDDPNKGLCTIIDALPGDATVIFTSVNDDVGAEEARSIIDFRRFSMRMFPPTVYLSLLSHCDVLIGNSSSGIFEAPYLGTMVVNVGNRQRGRAVWGGVEHVQADVSDIRWAINKALERRLMPPLPAYYYGDGHACEKIVKVLKEVAR